MAADGSNRYDNIFVAANIIVLWYLEQIDELMLPFWNKRMHKTYWGMQNIIR